MPKSIQALREERSTLANDIHTLVNDHEGEWTAANQENYQAKVAAVENIDKHIERKQKALDVSASDYERIQSRADDENISHDEAHHRDASHQSAVVAFCRGGMNNLTDDQRASLRARVNSPSNTLSTGTGSEGGYLTRREYADSLTEAMKAYGGIRDVANVIQSETGAAMDFPTTDSTSEEGEIVGESKPVGRQVPSFGTKELLTYKYSSKVVPVPFELLQDSQFAIEAHINDLLSMRLGRITEKHYAAGTGVGQPRGILVASPVGKVAGSASLITHEDLLDLEHSIDPIYRGRARYMFHDSVLRQLRGLKDTQGRPLWLPGLTATDPNIINGYAYTVNQSFAPISANVKAAAFGDFSKYIIRDVMQVALFRFTDSVYTEQGQVGFLAFMRSGGNLIDVGGAIKTLQMGA